MMFVNTFKCALVRHAMLHVLWWVGGNTPKCDWTLGVATCAFVMLAMSMKCHTKVLHQVRKDDWVNLGGS